MPLSMLMVVVLPVGRFGRQALAIMTGSAHGVHLWTAACRELSRACTIVAQKAEDLTAVEVHVHLASDSLNPKPSTLNFPNPQP